MKVVSERNVILNSEANVETIDGYSGLVLESRGGAKGKSNERNTDYFEAMDTILERLKSREVREIEVFVVSSKALKDWDMENRQLILDGNRQIKLQKFEPKSLRGKLSKAQQLKKIDPNKKGGNPTKRILIYAGINEKQWLKVIQGSATAITVSDSDIDSETDVFDPHDNHEAVKRILRSIAYRQGQPKFRKQLLAAYENKCAITECEVLELLEAAHIVPFSGEKTNHISNGLLLRADIHTLFDRGLLGVSKEYKVMTSETLEGTEYEMLKGQTIRLPKKPNEMPSLKALGTRPRPLGN